MFKTSIDLSCIMIANDPSTQPEKYSFRVFHQGIIDSECTESCKYLLGFHLNCIIEFIMFCL
jgi:hypothetical protein